MQHKSATDAVPGPETARCPSPVPEVSAHDRCLANKETPPRQILICVIKEMAQPPRSPIQGILKSLPGEPTRALFGAVSIIKTYFATYSAIPTRLVTGVNAKSRISARTLTSTITPSRWPAKQSAFADKRRRQFFPRLSSHWRTRGRLPFNTKALPESHR
ncbi:hypothetical protein HPP92_015286 [Vanilla planifolia]|uniref:Uncharacterized protein n=1 Tax=Vanilla planifolia TaxID=51239 RepID=A0A835QP77_VANPL|nr:hypothetical protein HPP92_015286 [Vanilla planifolia]